ncbi:response regulator [Deltaproteobacteria bacterium TL4]
MSSSFNILIVDDSRISLTLVAEYLSEYTVQCVTSAEECLKIFDPKIQDLIITDLVMPRLNGLQLLQKIHEKDAEFPVIVLTSSDNIKQVDALFEAGAYEYLQKPLNRAALLFSVKRLQKDQELAKQKERLLREKAMQTKEFMVNLNQSLDAKIQEILLQVTTLSRLYTEDLTEFQRQQMEGIQNITLFSGFNALDLRLIARELTLLSFEKGCDLLSIGEEVEQVLFIKNGVVDVLVGGDRVAQRGPGDSLGEMSCLSGNFLATATVRALTPCEVWGIDRNAFTELLSRIPELRFKMFQVVTNRLEQTSLRMGEIFKHVPHGIIKITLDGVISNEFSSQSTSYLGLDQLSGRALGPLLFAENENLLTQWNQVFQLIAQSSLSVSDALSQLPTEVMYLHPKGEMRTFQLFYYLNRSTAGTITGVDVCIDDVTEQRAHQQELSSVHNLLMNLDDLLILFDAKTGAIIQETFSYSHLGKVHFSSWTELKEQSFFDLVLSHQEEKLTLHMNRWLKMISDPFSLNLMSAAELLELAPSFRIETDTGQMVEISFMIRTDIPGPYSEILSIFKFIEEDSSTEDVSISYSTIKLMDELRAVESEKPQELREVLDEMCTLLEVVQNRMGSSTSFVKYLHEIARNIHSIKGLGQSFKLQTIAEVSHAVEDMLQQALHDVENASMHPRLMESLKLLMELIVISKSVCGSEKNVNSLAERQRPHEIAIPVEVFSQLKRNLDQLVIEKNEAWFDSGDLEAFHLIKTKILALDCILLANVFPRLQQIAEDLGRGLRKEVRLRFQSDWEVSLNVHVGQTLHSLLIQMVKNAVCHGIEIAQVRKLMKKNPEGTVFVEVTKEPGTLCLTVRDDGQGIDPQEILEKAVQLDMLDPEKAITLLKEKKFTEILDFLFLPGLSTAQSVSLISGRGVGLEIVKTEITKLGGSVSIESVLGQGTRFIMHLPLEPNQIKLVPSHRT